MPRVVELSVSPPAHERIETPAERASEGILTVDYEALINTADFISILKLKARRRLSLFI